MEQAQQRGKKDMKLMPLSEWYDRRKIERLIKVIKANDEEIMKKHNVRRRNSETARNRNIKSRKEKGKLVNNNSERLFGKDNNNV